MPQKVAFSPQQEAQIVERYENGETCQKIAKSLNYSSAIIKRVLESHGVYEYGRRFEGRYSEAQKQDMIERYLSGETMTSLGKSFKCDRLNVRNILLRKGVEIRRERTHVLSESDAAIIRARRSDGLNFSDIAREMGVPPHRVLTWARQMGISDFRGKRGADSPFWCGGRTKHQGYTLIRLAPDDPLFAMAGPNSYAPEHRVVMARSLGRQLEPYETVHHINGVRSDNRLENLQLRKGNHGKGQKYVCLDCGSHNVRTVRLDD